MPVRNLDSVQLGACDPNYYDGTGARFMTYAYQTNGLQSWGNTPNYFDARKNFLKGGSRLLTNQFYRYEFKKTHPRGVVNYYPDFHPEWFHKMSGLLDQYSTWDPGYGNYDVNLALLRQYGVDLAVEKALSKAKDQTVNFGQNIGEYKSTAGTPGQVGKGAKGIMEDVIKNIGNVVDMTVNAKRGNWSKVRKAAGLKLGDVKRMRKTAKGTLKDVSDGWLAWQYGIKPVLNDLQEAIILLAELKAPRDFVHRAVGSYRASAEETWNNAMGLGNAWLGTFTREITTNAKCSLEYEIDDPFAHDMSRFGITNVVALGYELLTLSFVLDWFIGIGKYLSNLDATRGLVFRRGTISCRVESKVRGSAAGTSAGGWTYEGSAVSESSQVLLTRDALSGFPSPPLPRFKDPISLFHVTSAVALAVQRMK